MHWYDDEGNAQHYQVIKSGINKGKKRSTTLKDAKKLGLKPSVTGIIGVMDKGEGLTNFLIRQAVEKALNPKIVQRDYAAEGTKIHGYIEDWVCEGVVKDEAATEYILAVEECFKEYGVKEPISEEHFCTDSYGGAVDLHDKEAKIIIDIKTKDFDEPKDPSKFIYDNHAMQLYAYREGLGMPEDTKLVNLFLSRTSPELSCSYEHPPEGIERAGKMFNLCLQLWKLKNRMP